MQKTNRTGAATVGAALAALLGGFLPPLHAQTPTGKIAFRSHRDGNAEIYVMNADGSNVTRVTRSTRSVSTQSGTTASFDNAPAFSSDGRRIAFTSFRDGHGEVYVANTDGTGQMRLTFGDELSHIFDGESTFSPDGSRIAFTSARDGGSNRFEVHRMNADGTGQTRLTNHGTFTGQSSFSPDGARIVYYSRAGSSADEVWLMNADGSNQTRLTNNTAFDFDPVFTPDGTRIVFVSNRDGNNEIYIMNADGSGQTRLTTSATNDFQPTISPDGAFIAFCTNRDGNDEIYVMNINGTNPTRLTTNSGIIDGEPSWGPVAPSPAPPPSLPFHAGGKIAFESSRDGNGNHEIYVMNADGLNQTRLTDNLVEDRKPGFSYDGQRIVFARGALNQEAIWIMNADGTGATQLTTPFPLDRDPASHRMARASPLPAIATATSKFTS